MRIQLIADVLDEQLKDVHGVNAGRVDGIVLQVRENRPPKVAYIEVSPITLFARFNLRFAHWYARIDRRFGEGRGVPFRIPFSRVTREGPTLKLDFDGQKTPIDELEGWLRDHIVARMPFGGKNGEHGHADS